MFVAICIAGYLRVAVMNGPMRFLPVSDGEEWMKLLNGVDLHKLLEGSPPKEKPYWREVAT